MIPIQHQQVLIKIATQLMPHQINWVLTGSTSFALQGVAVEANDIDVQTDEVGAYAIGQIFAKYMIQPVAFRVSERIQSHFGVFQINGLEVEIMGDIQKRDEAGIWEVPVDLSKYKRLVNLADVAIPVLSLEYEYQAYLKLGRPGKAALIKARLGQSVS